LSIEIGQSINNSTAKTYAISHLDHRTSGEAGCNLTSTRNSPLKEGDLLLQGRYLLNQRHGSKLKTREEGVHVSLDVIYNGKNEHLWDFNIGEVVRRKKRAFKR